MRRASVFVSVVAVALLGLAAPAIATGQEATPAASPEAGVTIEVLIEATIPAEALPRNEVLIGFLRVTWPVGARYDLPAGASGDGVVVDVVLSGSYGVRNDGRTFAVRGGQVEPVPAGEEVVLGPGEGGVYLDNDAAWAVRNAGDAPLVVLAALVFSTAEPAVQAPPLPAGASGEPLGVVSSAGLAPLPAGPLTLAIRRVTLAPGASLVPSEETFLTLRYVDAGALTWEATPPGVATPLPPVTFGRGQRVPDGAMAEGRRLALRNAGDEPLVLLELVIAPAAPNATPVTVTPAV